MEGFRGQVAFGWSLEDEDEGQGQRWALLAIERHEPVLSGAMEGE